MKHRSYEIQTLRTPVNGPVPIMQRFGDNEQLYAPYGLKGHNGVDWGVHEFTPVYAMASGVVRFAGDGLEEVLMGASAGVCILTQHSGSEGFSFLLGYAHLNKVFVNSGDTVEEGDCIALSGKSGMVTGDHLHVELIPQPIDFRNGYVGRADINGWLRV